MRFTNPRAGILSIAAARPACAPGNAGEITLGGQDPDPVVLDIPVADDKGPVPAAAELGQIDARELGTVSEGSDLWLRARAAPDVPERNITERVTGGLWSVRDVDVSYDGNRLVFAMRMPLIPGAMEDRKSGV